MSAADFSRSGLTYSWKKNLPFGVVWANSSMENDELFDTWQQNQLIVQSMP